MKFGLYFLLAVLSSLAMGQAKTRPATEADFVGYWRIALIANEKTGSRHKNEDMGYADPCQFFIHKPNGTWYNISLNNLAGREESLRQCPTSKAAIDVALFPQSSVNPPRFSWVKVRSQDGLFFVQDNSVTDPNATKALLWKADYVLENTPAVATIGFDLNKGDMIMQRTASAGGNNLVIVWPMILRPVPN